jgi:hypothetical protein
MKYTRLIGIALFALGLDATSASSQQPVDWKAVETAIGRSVVSQPGDVYRSSTSTSTATAIRSRSPRPSAARSRSAGTSRWSMPFTRALLTTGAIVAAWDLATPLPARQPDQP